jgi:hypothetical protein
MSKTCFELQKTTPKLELIIQTNLFGKFPFSALVPLELFGL